MAEILSDQAQDPIKPHTDDEAPSLDPIQPNIDDEAPVQDCIKPNTDDEAQSLDPIKPNINDEDPSLDPIKPNVDDQAPSQDPIKPYTDDVYAATPSSGSRGDGAEDSEENNVQAIPTAQPESVNSNRLTIAESLACKDVTKSSTVSDWVSQASSYNAENPVAKGDETLESASANKSENMEVDDTTTGDNAVEDVPSENGKDNDEEEDGLPTTFKIFVSNLPHGLYNSELMELFDQYGEVVQCELFGKSYAFVYMTSEECGENAIEGLNGYELRGRRINVKRSLNSSGPAKVKNVDDKPKPEKPTPAEPETGLEVGTFKLYIGNLIPDVTKEYVATMLEPYGRTVEIEIFRGNSAFVHMETEEGARKAIEELNGKTLPDSEDAIKVSESKNPEGPSLPAIRLMVKNLPVEVSAEKLRELFVPYGLVLKVALTQKAFTSSTHRTAAVHLEQFGNIRSAIKDLCDKEVEGSIIKVEADFKKPEVVKPKYKPSKPSHEETSHPYGSWQPADSEYRAASYSQHSSSEFRSRSSGRSQSANQMRLIPMPSKDDLDNFPRSGLQGRRLLRPEVPPPPLMSQRPFDEPSPWGQEPPQWGQGWDYNNYSDYERGYNQALNDGFGGGYNYNSSEYDDWGEEGGYNNEHEEYEEYDWSQYGSGNDYTPPPKKVPRNNAWNNSQNFGGYTGQHSKQMGWGNGQTKNNGGGGGYNGKKKKGKGKFPQLPNANEFPLGPPPPSYPKASSVQIPANQESDWSADLPLSNLASGFSGGFNATANQNNSTNAVPFDYSQMKNRKSFGGNPLQEPYQNVMQNMQGGNSQGRGKSNRKGKARRPGLGTTQQQKKAAHQTGNDETFASSSSTQFGDWQPVNSFTGGGSTSLTSSNTDNAPGYFQQNWSFAKGKQNKQGFRKPSAKEMKQAEEDQKRQYADYLKQKPWLYQTIPGTVKKVQQ